MLGVTVFALTGALAAARDRQDIITFWFFAVVTGIGGGTLRDLLIGAPVFWIGDATYLGIGLAAAVDRVVRRAASRACEDADLARCAWGLPSTR